MSRIHLVRHGRSAHVHAGWVDLDGFHRWRESYEAAAILADETAPAAVVELAKSARVIAASNTPRAIASAKLLREEDIVLSPLLRELDLKPLNLRGIKLPLALWALTFAIRRTLATPSEEARARDAAVMVEELAHEGDVVVVTHHTFRSLLAKTLMGRGWESGKKPGPRHWSVWTLERSSQ